MTLGKTIKRLRAQEGVGIKTLGPRLGVDPTYLSKLENDRARPSQAVIRRIARYFHYDSEELSLLAGRVPPDVQKILQDNPREAIAFLRKRFVNGARRESS
jgi:transcriptional regulator with XRE-family HTH domain